MTETRSILWEIANELRGHGPFDPLRILQTAKARGVTFDLEDVRLPLAMNRKSDFLCPRFIPTFIAAYLKDMAPNSVLDVWAGIGAMVAPIVQELVPTKAIALEQNHEAYEIARLLGHETGIEWHLGFPLHMIDEIKLSFDVVIGSPPWNWKPQSLTFSLDGRDIEIHDDKDKLLILKASQLLSPGGVGFFITSPSFTVKRGKRTVYANLSRFGLFIDAILTLPSGTFSGTSLSGLLVIIRKQKPEQLFVGELSSNLTSNDVLLKNLKARKKGKVLQLGTLVKTEEFISFQALVYEYEIKELVRRLGFPPTPLVGLATEINLVKLSPPDAFVDHPNTLYLPLIGKSPAVSSLADLELKHHNYAQIVVNPDEAIAEYLAHFFNTTLGRKIRESLGIGTFVSKINKPQLLKATVYIPDLDTQAEALRVNASIVELSKQLETLNRRLWKQPRDAKKILKSVNSLNQEDSFENWLDNLPFPLSSILWTYHAEDNPISRVEHLLDFFEALSEFNTVLMLSAYASDHEFYVKHSNAWLITDPKYQEWYKTANFGNWTMIGQRLAKATRRFISEEETREHCLDLFGRPAPEFIDLLIDKRLFAILGTALNYRNSWKGHDGIGRLSHQEALKRLPLLEVELTEIRRLVADRYSTALLLRPDSSVYRDGIHCYRVNALVGRTLPFKKFSVRTLSPMDTQKLYLLHENQLKPVELLPFIQLAGAPENVINACYFYSRIENNQAHYVSYHFIPEPALDRPRNDLENAFKLLKPSSNFLGGE